MVSDKDRLYIALHARSGPGYHWSLITGPKVEDQDAQGKRFHAKETMNAAVGRYQWEYETTNIRLTPERQVLVRIMFAKVINPARLVEVMSRVASHQDIPTWRCRHWVRDAIAALKVDGQVLGSANLDWTDLETTANWYVELKKSQHRFDGKVEWDTNVVPTYDVLARKEIIA